MSQKQLSKLDVLNRLLRKELSAVEAAALLGVDESTVRRRRDRLASEGPGSLVHGLTGHPSNNRLSSEEEASIGRLLSERYPDFKPGFAAEKLREIHGIDRDPKTVRRIMVGLGLWEAGRHGTKPIHRFWRLRKGRRGELVQFDGSYEDWFEGRAATDEQCLLAAIDDATGAILRAAFAESEGVLPVMGFWLEYAKIHGLPQAVYVDKFSTYRMHLEEARENDDAKTQFGRAMAELGVKPIFANSPQAKGRVERLFGTLQDRLIKELRLAGIRTTEAANRFLEERFVPDFNRRFGRAAREEGDLHRRLCAREIETLPLVLCRREGRIVRNDFTVSYRTALFQLLPTPRLLIRPKDDVTTHELVDGDVRLHIRGKEARYRTIQDRAEARSPAGTAA